MDEQLDQDLVTEKTLSLAFTAIFDSPHSQRADWAAALENMPAPMMPADEGLGSYQKIGGSLTLVILIMLALVLPILWPLTL